MTSTDPQRRRDDGFTLLEVLVAFAILAIALGVLMQVFSSGLNTANVAERYAWATSLAESHLASIGADEPLRVGEESGELGRGFRWVRTVTAYYDDDHAEDIDGLRLYDVEVTVRWQEPSKTRSVSLRTLRLVNEASER